jgi:hypothetical protein
MKKLDLLIKIIAIFALILISASLVFYFVWRPYANEKRMNICTKNVLNKFKTQGTTVTFDKIKEVKEVCSVGYYQDKYSNNIIEKCNF